jgi:hypothetical protein
MSSSSCSRHIFSSVALLLDGSSYARSDQFLCSPFVLLYQYVRCFFSPIIILYRVIRKSLCTWWLEYRKVQVVFKVSPASLQTFIDTPNCVIEDRVQYGTVHIPNVFCAGHLQIISFCVFLGTVIVRCTETFWSPCTVFFASIGIDNYPKTGYIHRFQLLFGK